MTPSIDVWPIFENGPASLKLSIDTSLVTSVISAEIREPVASVPMNESIFITTTTVALIKPIRSPAARPRNTAGTHGTVPAMKCAVITPDSVIVYANERSNTRAASGIVIASAANAVIALVLRICFAVVTLGNVCGTQIENTITIPIQTYTAPIRLNARPLRRRDAKLGRCCRELRDSAGGTDTTSVVLLAGTGSTFIISLYGVYENVLG